MEGIRFSSALRCLPLGVAFAFAFPLLCFALLGAAFSKA
jgi:hypothetical protein